jgi:cell wall-associated NlpC family hydrolase
LLFAACATTEPIQAELASQTDTAEKPGQVTEPSENTPKTAEIKPDKAAAPPEAAADKPASTIETAAQPKEAETVAAKVVSSNETFAPAAMTARTVSELPGLTAAIPPPPSHQTGSRRPPRGRVQSLSGDQVDVLESAFTLLGLPPDCPVTVNGRHFKLDCIGTVSAIFYNLGIDITKDFNRYTGNGVGRLFKSLKDKGALHMDRFPHPGDIVFWNNTWDANGDGSWKNDPTTHAGVVLQVEDDGTIHYIHEHVRKGVIVERMNLYRPEIYRTDFGKILNNAMALGSYYGNPNNPEHWLSGDLWYQFGGMLTVKDQYKI